MSVNGWRCLSLFLERRFCADLYLRFGELNPSLPFTLALAPRANGRLGNPSSGTRFLAQVEAFDRMGGHRWMALEISPRSTSSDRVAAMSAKGQTRKTRACPLHVCFTLKPEQFGAQARMPEKGP
jgi:hypothetical protein